MRELDDFVGGIEFVDRFAPAGGRKLDGEAARGDEIERLSDEICESTPSAGGRGS